MTTITLSDDRKTACLHHEDGGTTVERIKMLYDFGEDGPDYEPFIDSTWSMPDGEIVSVILGRKDGIVTVYRLTDVT